MYYYYYASYEIVPIDTLIAEETRRVSNLHLFGMVVSRGTEVRYSIPNMYSSTSCFSSI